MKHAETVALVPLNRLDAAKSRLSMALPRLERRALVKWMASRVLAALRDSERIAAIGVVSPDHAMLDWAMRSGAVPVPQEHGDLNDGLEMGRAWALSRGADTLLVLLGDLPYLSPREVRDFLAVEETEVGSGPLVVLAPDQYERGTNGLLLRPADALPFAFGEGSLARHEAAARERDIPSVRFHANGLQYDVDTPADLRRLWMFLSETPASTAETHSKPA